MADLNGRDCGKNLPLGTDLEKPIELRIPNVSVGTAQFHPQSKLPGYNASIPWAHYFEEIERAPLAPFVGGKV